MNTVAFTRLMYGADYSESVYRALAPHVDKYVIIYTSVPTFGHSTDLRCPDNELQLHRIARSVLRDKLIWLDHVPQRHDVVFSVFGHVDLLFEADADEVYHGETVEQVKRDYDAGKLTDGRYRLPMVHHWRSFRYICRDQGWPDRLAVNVPNAEAQMYPYPEGLKPIHHFGYARRDVDMLYKMALSVHKPEWRPEWWTDIYNAYPSRLQDLHPVVKDMWNAEEIALSELPSAVQSHPYARLGVIR